MCGTSIYHRNNIYMSWSTTLPSNIGCYSILNKKFEVWSRNFWYNPTKKCISFFLHVSSTWETNLHFWECKLSYLVFLYNPQTKKVVMRSRQRDLPVIGKGQRGMWGATLPWSNQKIIERNAEETLKGSYIIIYMYNSTCMYDRFDCSVLGFKSSYGIFLITFQLEQLFFERFFLPCGGQVVSRLVCTFITM